MVQVGGGCGGGKGRGDLWLLSWEVRYNRIVGLLISIFTTCMLVASVSTLSSPTGTICSKEIERVYDGGGR